MLHDLTWKSLYLVDIKKKCKTLKGKIGKITNCFSTIYDEKNCICIFLGSYLVMWQEIRLSPFLLRNRIDRIYLRSSEESINQ